MERFFLLVIGILLFSCENKKSILYAPLSDTTKVLNRAFAMGVDIRYMPDAGGLKGRSQFGDTILLTSQTLPPSLLPREVDEQIFKIMSREDVCAAIANFKNLDVLPKYLNISRFEKNDSGYYVQLQSISCGEFASGGSSSIYLKKISDSFVVVSKQASSIN